jgi:hypothetical protein
MSKKIRFSIADGDKTIGTATLNDADELEYENDAVKAIMTPMRNRIGDIAAFDVYADWSNGYVVSKLVGKQPVVAHGGVDAATAPAVPAPPATAAQPDVHRWRGLIGPFNVMSGDKRMLISPGRWDCRDLPLPASYQREDAPGHDGAVTVARMLSATIGADGYSADGDWLESVPECAEAMSLLEAGVLYPSVDLDDIEFEFRTPDGTKSLDDLTDNEWEDMMMSGLEPVMAITAGRLAKVTFLACQAFPQTTLELYQGQPAPDRQMPTGVAEPMYALAAAGTVAAFSATGDTSLPVADRDTKWDGGAATSNVLAWAKGSSDVADAGKLAKAFFWQDPDADPSLVGSYKLPFADVFDGQLKIVYAGVSASAGRLDQTQIPDHDRDAVKAKVSAAYSTCSKAFDDPDVKPPWAKADASLVTIVAGNVVAGGKVLKPAAAGRVAGPVYPPEAWFADPQLKELTPVTVLANGQLFGHLADRDCHLSFLGQECILPPEEGGFEWFHRGEIETAEATLVRIGLITAATGHAMLELSAGAAADHYDKTGTQVAQIRCGRDKHGTWVAGSIVPEATDAQVQMIRRSPLSGDWRLVGGRRELIAALAVNVPGFPVIRGRKSRNRAVSLVASGWNGWKTTDRTVPPRSRTQAVIDEAVARALQMQATRIAVATAADKLAATIGRDRQSLVAELDQLVHEGA